ncbi:MAG: putative phospholipid ABC transporter permease protein MlaE [Syntrophorhabdaceae bacterium PtaU1.Bin034]|nr:MAG: putative phospholipid ABC transporter permease protein MlaE [Syntrophorhabdaceae bacterium PtaU1.Bin034]
MVRGESGLGQTAGNSDRPHSLALRFFATIGRATLVFVNDLGALFIFFVLSFAGIFRRKQFVETMWQVYHVSAKSSGIVILVGLFTGMVLGLQLFYTLIQFGSVSALGAAISLSLIRELGPVLTAIMIAARSGSGMAAEIGILRISEQIDALDTMGIDPVRFLVSPRLAASLIGFPILTAFFDLIGIIGGYITGVILMGSSAGAYFYRVQASVTIEDIRGGFIKTIVFAVIVSIICCFEGFFCHMRTESSGAKSVGLATRGSVVLSCTMILVSDYVVTSFLM